MKPDGPSGEDARVGASGPRTTPHGTFFEGAGEDAHEHGERSVDTRREDALVGTSGTHTPSADLRPEEPAGELAASADTEGGVD